ncbi:MAG: WYL domain-containing protein [Gammaproteobacteria bacterium]|nr:WYL domain-containing protein [Gammaproteobacteria bacterium]
MAKEYIERFQFIEIMIRWQGRVNASHLTKYFNLSRPSASRTFNKYIALHPNSIIYQDSIKGFVADAEFSLRYSTAEFSQYQSIVNSSSALSFSHIVDVSIPTRNPQQYLAQPILRAIDNKLAIDIGYTSLSTPQYKDRIIEPHSLVFDGLRWHVRAFCRKNMAFRDFVLSRFNGEVVHEGKAQTDVADDVLWHKIVELQIEPDQRLTPAQQKVISDDYQMTQGRLTITSRAALVSYLLKR